MKFLLAAFLLVIVVAVVAVFVFISLPSKVLEDFEARAKQKSKGHSKQEPGE